jgi:hypothetical protein
MEASALWIKKVVRDALKHNFQRAHHRCDRDH